MIDYFVSTLAVHLQSKNEKFSEKKNKHQASNNKRKTLRNIQSN